MGLISELLNYSREHAQTIIVILIGLIVIGSISGGLLIQNLNSSLSEKETLQRERINLIEERYRTSFAEVASKFLKLEDRVRKLGAETVRMETICFNMAKEISNIAQSEEINSENRNKLNSLSNNLSNYTGQILEKRGEIVSELDYDERVFRRLKVYNVPPPGFNGITLFLPAFYSLLLLVLVLIFSIVFLTIRYKKKLRKVKTEISN
jgi:hypothetical protein